MQSFEFSGFESYLFALNADGRRSINGGARAPAGGATVARFICPFLYDSYIQISNTSRIWFWIS